MDGRVSFTQRGYGVQNPETLKWAADIRLEDDITEEFAFVAPMERAHIFPLQKDIDHAFAAEKFHLEREEVVIRPITRTTITEAEKPI